MRIGLMFGLLLVTGLARAELVSLTDPAFRELQFVEGTSLNSSTFEIQEAGSYAVTLTDYAFPQSFEQLAVAITDAAASFFAGQVDGGEGDTIVFFDSPGTYVANVFATLGDGASGVGLYGLEITLAESQAVIPLPPAVLLLASGLLLLGARRRHR